MTLICATDYTTFTSKLLYAIFYMAFNKKFLRNWVDIWVKQILSMFILHWL